MKVQGVTIGVLAACLALFAGVGYRFLSRDTVLHGFESPAEQAAAVGRTFRECSVCPQLVVLPPGSFVMGSSEEDRRTFLDNGGHAGLAAQEVPPHRVDIGYTIAVARYEATWDEYDACVGEGACSERYVENRWGRRGYPAIYVSWEDVTQRYLPWLNRKAGLLDKPPSQQYRLLSEAEWEYAARANTTTAFSFGDRISSELANYDGSRGYNGAPAGPFRKKTMPVGSFAPNAFGLYDMHGNVAEWVQDAWHRNYENAQTDGGARPGDGSLVTARVIRGGAWIANPGALRSAFRARDTSDGSSFSIGFRVARTIPVATPR